MVAISVQHDLHKIKAEMTRIERDQIPFAASLAINAVARKAKEALPGAFERLLDRPKPFTTQSGFFSTNSNRVNLQATVGLKDIQAGYLAPLLSGQPRKQKGSEQRFMGRFFIPAPAVPLDSYGNVTKANLVAILKAAESKTEWKGKRIVVFPSGNGRLPPGVYASNKRRGLKTEKRGLTLLLRFVSRAPGYKKRLHLGDEVQRVVRGEFAGAFASAMARAVGSAT